MENALQFLGFSYTKEQLEKSLQDDFDTFKRYSCGYSICHGSLFMHGYTVTRAHGAEEDFDHYTPSQKEVINLKILELIEFFKSLDYRKLNFLNEYKVTT